MVGHGVTFGFVLTDEFGNPFYDELVSTIKTLYKQNNYNYPEGIVSFPSASDDQLVLGFFVNLDRNVDVPSLDAKWYDLLSKLPKELKTVCDFDEFDVPDFHVLSGKY